MFDLLTPEASKTIHKLYGLDGVDLHWESPKEAEHGDVSTAVALRLAKQLGKKPVEIAQEIADGLSSLASIEKTEIAGPGYVNIWLKPEVLLAELSRAHAACAPSDVFGGAPMVVDYSSPNIAKPLGIHHILSTVIGQCVVNLHTHAGTSMIRWNYLGDWGTQFGKLAVAYERWGSGKPVLEHSLDDLLALYVKFHDEAENESALEDEARAMFQKLEEGDATVKAFWSDVVAVTKQSLSAIYKRLNVSFDVEDGESHYQHAMQPIIDEGKDKGVFVPGEKGALIAQFDESAGMPPAVIVKGDGSTLYHTRDLALLRDRISRFHPQAVYYVVDMAQSLHFRQLFDIERQLGWDLPKQEHIAFGRMRFADGSMSTRKGNILKLEHVLDEAVKRASEIIKERGDSIQTDNPEDLAEMMGVGALVYGILSQNRKMDMVFDWDKMLSFEGNSAPYLQYTHARARSVLRKAEVDGSFAPTVESFTLYERNLVLTLMKFPQALEEAKRDHLPHKLANFLYDLCQSFNTFYNVEPILQADEPSRSLRLFLCHCVAGVLKSGASLLTIRVPDRM